jgi:hypothetical protein
MRDLHPFTDDERQALPLRVAEWSRAWLGARGGY